MRKDIKPRKSLNSSWMCSSTPHINHPKAHKPQPGYLFIFECIEIDQFPFVKITI